MSKVTSFHSNLGRLYGCVRRLNTRARNLASHLFEEGLTTAQSPIFSRAARERLLILDDIFPHLLSAFRIAEYNFYLGYFHKAEVHSTATAFPLAGEYRSFREVVKEYEGHYPQYRNRVFKFSPRRSYRGCLIYTIFLNNAYRFIDIAERHGVPFVFTLYPGGGFQLNNAEVDRRLGRVCSSRSFRRVIVTQRISYDYLVDRRLCPPDRIEFVYGGVLPSDRLERQRVAKQYYQRDKGTFDICFVANKYTPKGTDKGYDVFVEVARLLSRTHRDVFFHVVGPFDETDIDVGDIHGRMRFYGTQYTDFFPVFYSRMDIVLSPNAPFVLDSGCFDGFPTGSSVEAGLCGVAVFCTDVLNLNVAFKHEEEIVIISRDVAEICSAIAAYYRDYGDLYLLAGRGQQAFKRVFGLQAQMSPRLRILSESATKQC